MHECERVNKFIFGVTLGLLVIACTDQNLRSPFPTTVPVEDVGTSNSGEVEIINEAFIDMATAQTSDAHFTDMSEPTCNLGSERTMRCGLNDRGSSRAECTAGQWVVTGQCEDPDVCVDNQSESRPCEGNSTMQQVRICAMGQWADWSECPQEGCLNTLCDGECVDTQTNPDHCGQCEIVCEQGSECCEGTCVPRVFGDAPPLALLGACGTLRYGLYAAQNEEASVHKIPDFSYAGYRGGGVPIPDAPTVVTVSPGMGNDLSRIQAAIDEVGRRPMDANGIRGAVLLTAGQFEVDGTLEINTSGTVLRGEGQGQDGTVILATQRAKHALIRIQGDASGFGELSNTRADVISSYVPVGSRTMEVTDNVRFEVGDTIAIFRTPNEAWTDRLRMGQWGWEAHTYHIGHERKIIGIRGSELTVDVPFVDTIDAAYGGGFVFKSDMSRRLEDSGVEDLRLVSVYESDTDEDHGWDGVVLARASNSWVRRVTVEHFGYSAITLEDESAFNTIEEVAMLDPKSQILGGRRYAFNLADGIGNLFQRCYSRAGRHNFVSGSRTTGPNVWLDSLAVDPLSDEGPHHRWATGLLFDNIKSRDINVQNRTSSGTGHGWTGSQVLFWNVEAERIICDSPSGGMNYSVGSVGESTPSSYAPDEAACFRISPDQPVTPRSLYLQQLQDRLGVAAVENVTTESQRSGRIWVELTAWAGEGPLSTVVVDEMPTDADPNCMLGIPNGNICCEMNCGSCGGSGCGMRPGGPDNCCVGRIRSANSSCNDGPAPCVMNTP